MSVCESFLEKWRLCRESRYPVMLIIPSQQDIFSELIIEKIAGLIEGKLLDFEVRYQVVGKTCFTWSKVREEIYSYSCNHPVIVTNLEPFYSKWTIEERLAFLRNILRTESPYGMIIILYCLENLTEIRSIPENSRGLIWAP